VLFWLHILATGLFLGTTAGLALFTVPAVQRIADGDARRRSLARALRIYDPLAIGLLGVMVMTGAWSITALKEAMGSDYFARVGAHLAWKLGFAFLVVMSGTYVAMGIGHRIVRSLDFGDPTDERLLASQATRLRGAAWMTVALTVATVVVALRR
jgi:4-hydroxybenzoate polyprenyltransferase